MKKTVLLVDDDVEVLKINAKYLGNAGYQVLYTNNPLKVKDVVAQNTIDCVVLDVMMPRMNGFELCELIRQSYDVPIIFLTGKVEEDDMIEGLTLGADDYMTKPYSLKELAARIMVNIRRKESVKKAEGDTSTKIELPPLMIDVVEHRVYCDNEEISLSNKEFDLLLFLVNNVNKTVTFREIGEKLWGMYDDNDRKNVMVNASRLRKKIAMYEGLEDAIENVWSKGYRYIYKS